MKNYVTLAFTSLLVIGAVFLLWPKNNPIDLSTNSTAVTSRDDVLNDSLVIGEASAPASIIEYGDFKCPSCNRFHHTAGEELRKNYVEDGRLKIIFRNLPFIGPDSNRAAQGSFCANKNGNFTAYHDAVYDYVWDNYYNVGKISAEFEDVLSVDVLGNIAEDIGLNKIEFEQCLSSEEFKEEVNVHIKASEKDKATGTPFFVIDGQKVTGPQPYEVFRSLVDLQLRQYEN